MSWKLKKKEQGNKPLLQRLNLLHTSPREAGQLRGVTSGTLRALRKHSFGSAEQDLHHLGSSRKHPMARPEQVLLRRCTAV